MDKQNNETVTLKEICKERKLDPRLSRMLLREATKNITKYPNLAKNRKARTPWIWSTGSQELEEALTILNDHKNA